MEAVVVETADQVAVLDLVAVTSGETEAAVVEAAVVEGTVEAEVEATGAVAMVVAAAATVVRKV